MVLPSRYVQSLTSSLHFVLTKPTHFPAICSWWNPIDLRSTPALFNLFSTENPRDTFFKKMKVLSYELLPMIKCTDFKSTNRYILTNVYILLPCRSSHRTFISRPDISLMSFSSQLPPKQRQRVLWLLLSKLSVACFRRSNKWDPHYLLTLHLDFFHTS